MGYIGIQGMYINKSHIVSIDYDRTREVKVRKDTAAGLWYADITIVISTTLEKCRLYLENIELKHAYKNTEEAVEGTIWLMIKICKEAATRSMVEGVFDMEDLIANVLERYN